MIKLPMTFSLIILILFCNACSTNQPKQNSADFHSLQQISAEDKPDTQQLDHSKQKEATENPTSTNTLSFQDFTARWNATSEEQMSNLYIKDLEKSPTTTDTYDYARLRNTIELRIYTDQNHIRQLEVIGDDKTPSTVLPMLTSWSQMILMLHPNNETDDVDTIFNKIGVGPNSDISKIKQQSFTYKGILYEVIPTESGFIFRAIISS